jgi:hypothetical protein
MRLGAPRAIGLVRKNHSPDAPKRMNLRETAIPGGAEQHLGTGGIPHIQQGVVADLSRLQQAYRSRITTAALQAKAAASAPGS